MGQSLTTDAPPRTAGNSAEHEQARKSTPTASAAGVSVALPITTAVLDCQSGARMLRGPKLVPRDYGLARAE